MSPSFETLEVQIEQQVASACNVQFVDYVHPEEAIHADVHVASLKTEWNHVCVPSKAVSSICLGKPVLFVGDTASDTSHLLAPGLWRLQRSDAPDIYRRNISDALIKISEYGEVDKLSANATATALKLVELKARTYSEISIWISGLNT